MENGTQNDLLHEEDLLLHKKSRKDLLPWWVKMFAWIFLLTGITSPLVLVLGLTGTPVTLSLYGLNTTNALSPIGLVVVALFTLKGITAFSLLKQRKEAITLAFIDAILGIGVCVLAMLYPITATDGYVDTSFRLELVFLFLYLVKMAKIQEDWKAALPSSSSLFK